MNMNFIWTCCLIRNNEKFFMFILFSYSKKTTLRRYLFSRRSERKTSLCSRSIKDFISKILKIYRRKIAIKFWNIAIDYNCSRTIILFNLQNIFLKILSIHFKAMHSFSIGKSNFLISRIKLNHPLFCRINNFICRGSVSSHSPFQIVANPFYNLF